jgi:hypothetical protein
MTATLQTAKNLIENTSKEDLPVLIGFILGLRAQRPEPDRAAEPHPDRKEVSNNVKNMQVLQES